MMLTGKTGAKISFLCTLTLLITEFSIQVIGTEYTIECLSSGFGNTDLFATTLRDLLPGDVLLLGPCEYQFEVDYILGEGNNSPNSDKFETTEGVLIKGTGSGADETVLNTAIEHFPVNVIFENLTFSGIQYYGPVYYTDSDTSILFRKCVLITGATSWLGKAVYSLCGRLTFIDSRVINGGTSTADAVFGVWVESANGHVMGLMRSKIIGFPIGLFARNWDLDEEYRRKDSVKVHETKLSTNSIECCVEYDYSINEITTCVDQSCPLEEQNLNTPQGSVTIKMNENIDVVGEFDYSVDQYLPFKIFFPKVLIEGQTFTYKLFSAHPLLPTHDGSQYHKGIAEPQYFQFDSTAKLATNKKVVVTFEKSVIDSNFNNPETVKAFISTNGRRWKKKPLKLKVKVQNGVSHYQVRFPKKKKLKVLVAFGEIENDG